MNDVNMGRVEGLMISLLIAERHKKHPERIQPEITRILQAVGIDIAQTAIDVISCEAEVWAKSH